jgi:NO-binding membrane sensor protein with MHYT domain
MPVPAPQPQNSQAIAVIAFFVAALCVRYWRQALRLIVIAVIALAVLGLIVGLHGIHYTAR